jgi:hypothetical protein
MNTSTKRILPPTLNASVFSTYIAKDPLLLTKHYPDLTIRYYFPQQVLDKSVKRNRVNVLVVSGLVSKVWIG